MNQYSAQHPIAFFCAEYGFDNRLPLYAGGLGILAGDIMKAAGDMHLPFVGVGLLYKGCLARQRVTEDGWQQEEEFAYDPLSAGLEHVYKDDMPLFIKVHLTEVDVWVRVWKKQFGPQTTLYLLDTDTDQNHLEERDIAACLYSGTEEALLKQQLILGIGGVKLLHALEIHPSLYHINEGRPAFLHWQLIRNYMDEHGMTFDEARRVAISKTVYTNHTLIGAGNPTHNMDLLKAFSRYYAERMGITVEQLLEPGVDDKGSFNVTRFALQISSKASAVSQLHFRFCQKTWPGFNWSGITNGVHLPTWQSRDVASAMNQPQLLWQAHVRQKEKLAQFVQRRTGFTFDPQRMVITWARRVTEYKQLSCLFDDMERLQRLVSAEGRQIQLLVSGKAHAYDEVSKAMLQQIIKHFQNELSGFALYIPNYDIEVAQHVVAGSDLWLNTPQFGWEASGTSGMKAVSNGVLQATVPDGWAAEVDWNDKGWSLNADTIAEDLYAKLEQEIVPEFFTRNEDGVPETWVKKMQLSMQLAPQYSAERMVREYCEKLYC